MSGSFNPADMEPIQGDLTDGSIAENNSIFESTASLNNPDVEAYDPTELEQGFADLHLDGPSDQPSIPGFGFQLPIMPPRSERASRLA